VGETRATRDASVQGPIPGNRSARLRRLAPIRGIVRTADNFRALAV